MEIIELRQTGENDWKAKYDGNYGVYTILLNALLLEFAANAENTKGNKYSGIIRKALSSVPTYEDDYYSEDAECIDIDVLDQWFDKAKYCVSIKQYKAPSRG